jgi:hypothetical protein
MPLIFLHTYNPGEFSTDQVCQAAREFATRAKLVAAIARQDVEASRLRAMALLQESRTRLDCSQATLEATLMTAAALQAVEAVVTQPVWRGRRRQ